MQKIVIIACSILLCVSCSKNGDSTNDKQAPGVTFSSPSNNQVFVAGENVPIIGVAVDNVKIAEMHFHIYNNVTSALLIDIHRFPDMQSLTFGESFVAQAGTQYKIQIIAIDNSGNQGTATVLAQCN